MTLGTRLGNKRKWIFRGLLLATIAGGLIALELGLRGFWPAALGDLHERQNPAGMPYFEVSRQDDHKVYRPSQYYRAWGHGFEFVMPKPEGRCRILVIGDSAAHGSVFFNPGAFAKWLEAMLPAVDPWTRYEVINTAQPGFPSAELLALESQVLAADPDLIVVYSGNNEFFYGRGRPRGDRISDFHLRLSYRLKSLAVVKAIIGLAKRLDPNRVPEFKLEPEAIRAHGAGYIARTLRQSDDQTVKDTVLARYRLNLEQMAKSAMNRRCQVIFCTIPVNVRDYEPYGYQHGQGFLTSKDSVWAANVEEGLQYLRKNNDAGAMPWLKMAYKLDPAPAKLNFIIAHLFLRHGDPETAWGYFQAALINDPARDRAAEDTNEVIRSVADNTGAMLADAALEFRKAAQQTIPGDDLFIDNVHPTLEGQRIIALTILETMIQQNLFRPESDWKPKAIARADQYQAKMTRDYLFNSYYTAASVNAFAGRYARAKKWVDVALEYDASNPEGIKLMQCLEQILQNQPTNSNVPWKEFDLAASSQPRYEIIPPE